MVEAVITNLEIPDHDGNDDNVDNNNQNINIFVPEEELEPLDSPPPSPLILCCEWMAMKICGYSPPDKEEIISDGTKKKKKMRH